MKNISTQDVERLARPVCPRCGGVMRPITADYGVDYCPACNAAGRERGPCIPPEQHEWQPAIGSDRWVCRKCGDGK